MVTDSHVRGITIAIVMLVGLYVVDIPSQAPRLRRWLTAPVSTQRNNRTSVDSQYEVSLTRGENTVRLSVESEGAGKSLTQIMAAAGGTTSIAEARAAGDLLLDKRDVSWDEQFEMMLFRDRLVRRHAVERVVQVAFGAADSKHPIATVLRRFAAESDLATMFRKSDATFHSARRALLCQVFFLVHEDFTRSVFATELRTDVATQNCSQFEERYAISTATCLELWRELSFAGVTLENGSWSAENSTALQDVYVWGPLRRQRSIEQRDFVPGFVEAMWNRTEATSSSTQCPGPSSVVVVPSYKHVSATTAGDSSRLEDIVCMPPHRSWSIRRVPSQLEACDGNTTGGVAPSDAAPLVVDPRSGEWPMKKLRIAFLADLLSVLGVKEGERIMPNTPLENICMLPRLRAALRFSVFNRWMLNHFEPPLTEDDMIDEVEEAARNSNATEGSADSNQFSAVLNYRNVKMLKRSTARNAPLFYRLENTVIPSSSRSGPPEGYKARGRRVALDQLRDERWIRIRQFEVRFRSIKPRFIVKSKQLFLLPVIFASNNVGHVMFRYLSIRALLRSQLHNHVIMYTVVPSAALTFGSNNMYRAFYKSQHGAWASILSNGESSTLEVSRPNTIFDVTFQNGQTGFGGIAQFHRGQMSHMVTSRVQSLSKLVPAFQTVRKSLLHCLNLPPQGASAVKTVVFIQRRRRRILNDRDLVSNYLKGTKAGSVGGSIVDPATNIPVRFVFVTLEYLTLRQQIDMVSQADVLFGTMGAGQCWMLAMQPRTTVVELFSSSVMHCTGTGINTDRMKCDYSKLSVAGDLNHIGFPLHVDGWCPPLACDGTLTQAQFNGLLATALCTLGKSGLLAAKECHHHFLPLLAKSDNGTAVSEGNTPAAPPPKT